MVNGLVAMSPGFPKAPNKLSGELRRLAPALARAGVRVTLGRTRHGSKITVERIENGGAEPTATTTAFPVLPTDRLFGGHRVLDLGYALDDTEEGLRRALAADLAAPGLLAG